MKLFEAWLLDRITLDYELRLRFVDPEAPTKNIDIICGGSIQVSGRSNDSSPIYDEESLPDIAIMLVQSIREVFSASVVSRNELVLRGEDGIEYRLLPSNDFESWEVHWGGRLGLVCAPGGEVVEW